MCVASVKNSAKSNTQSLLWGTTINNTSAYIANWKIQFENWRKTSVTNQENRSFMAIFLSAQTAYISDISWIQIWSSDLRNNFVESEIHLEFVFKPKQIGSTFERHKLLSFQRLRILLSFALLFILTDVADRKLFRNGSRTPHTEEKEGFTVCIKEFTARLNATDIEPNASAPKDYIQLITPITKAPCTNV